MEIETRTALQKDAERIAGVDVIDSGTQKNLSEQGLADDLCECSCALPSPVILETSTLIFKSSLQAAGTGLQRCAMRENEFQAIMVIILRAFQRVLTQLLDHYYFLCSRSVSSS